jgi:hypothetical protein
MRLGMRLPAAAPSSFEATAPFGQGGGCEREREQKTGES